MSDKPTMDFDEVRKFIANKGTNKTIKLCYSGKEVVIKQLKMKDKKEFSKQMESKDTTVINFAIDKLLDAYVSINDNPINSKELVEDERLQLLIEIKKLSTSDTVSKIEVNCDKCKKPNNNIELNYETIETLNFKEPEDSNNIITISGEKAKVEVSAITRQDTLDIENYLSEKELESTSDRNYAYIAASIKKLYVNKDDLITSINLTFEQKIKLLDSLIVDDINRIDKYFSKCPSYGPTIMIKYNCKHCEAKNEQEVTVLSFFMT